MSLTLLSQCFPNPFFLMPKVIIPLLHSGLTETIQKYSSACWISAGVCSETLPIKKWRVILTPKPSTAEQVTV